MNKDCKNISFLLVIYVDQNLLCPWSLISQVQQLNSKWILLKPLTVHPKVRSGRKLVTVHNPVAVSTSGDLQHSRWILFDGGPSLRQVGQANVAEQQPECQIKVPKPTWHPRTSRTDVPPWLWSDSCRGKQIHHSVKSKTEDKSKVYRCLTSWSRLYWTWCSWPVPHIL